MALCPLSNSPQSHFSHLKERKGKISYGRIPVLSIEGNRGIENQYLANIMVVKLLLSEHHQEILKSVGQSMVKTRIFIESQNISLQDIY